MRSGRIQLKKKVSSGDGSVETLGEVRVVHNTGLVDHLVVLLGEEDLVRFDLDQLDLLFLRELHEYVVGNLLHGSVPDPREDDGVQEHDDRQGDQVIIQQWLFGIFDFFHRASIFGNEVVERKVIYVIAQKERIQKRFTEDSWFHKEPCRQARGLRSRKEKPRPSKDDRGYGTDEARTRDLSRVRRTLIPAELRSRNNASLLYIFFRNWQALFPGQGILEKRKDFSCR